MTFTKLEIKFVEINFRCQIFLPYEIKLSIDGCFGVRISLYIVNTENMQFLSLKLVFPLYLLFRLIVGKLFSLIWHLVCPKMCCNNFENRLIIEKVLPKKF